MNFNEEALKLHAEHKGKIEIRSKVPVNTRDDLSTAYTPGVAEPCRKIHADKKEVYKYTAKGNLVAVVSAGTAIIKMLLAAGVKHIIACDENGILYKERGVGIKDHKEMLCAEYIIPGALEPGVAAHVAERVAEAAVRSGAIRK